MSTFFIVILSIIGVSLFIYLFSKFVKNINEISKTYLKTSTVYSPCNECNIKDKTLTEDIKNFIDSLSQYLTITEEYTNKYEYYSKLSNLYKKFYFNFSILYFYPAGIFYNFFRWGI